MTEVEKLRALLAEARIRISPCVQAPCSHDDCCLRSRIDAALAEPVVGCAECAVHKAFHDVAVNQRDGNAYLLSEVQRERDEARAEVERLKEDREAAFFRGEDDGYRRGHKYGYQYGAEAMREAAAQEVDRLLTKKKATAIWVCADEIRALPIPEDKP